MFQEGSHYCPHCQRQRLTRRTVPNHLLHFLVTFFLLGLWLPVWGLVALTGYGPWRCSRCGEEVEGPSRSDYAPGCLLLLLSLLPLAVCGGLFSGLFRPLTEVSPAVTAPLGSPR